MNFEEWWVNQRVARHPEIDAPTCNYIKRLTQDAWKTSNDTLTDQEIINLAIENGFDSYKGEVIEFGWQNGADITPCVLAFVRVVLGKGAKSPQENQMLKLSELTADNIRNTKIHVKNEHESRAFQERVFELGAKWRGSLDAVVTFLDCKYLFISNVLGLSWSNVIIDFQSDTSTELQIDFTDKPSWADAPDWANWLAQDENGSWWWFSKKPKATPPKWHVGIVDTKGRYAERDGIPNPNWRETLEQRPDNIVDANNMVNQSEQALDMVSSQVILDNSKQFKIPPLDFILANGLGFAEGSIIECMHNGSVADLRKARGLIDVLIERARQS